MSDRRSRRALFASFTKRFAATDGETEHPQAEPLGAEAEVPASDPADALAPLEGAAPEPPWARRARAMQAPRAPGLARVLAFECLGGSPSFCSTCIEHCPVPGALELTQRAPRVNADLCDGCGRCEPVCPAPNRAIVVLPRTPGGPR